MTDCLTYLLCTPFEKIGVGSSLLTQLWDYSFCLLKVARNKDRV